jgi:predicted amino acid racemase
MSCPRLEIDLEKIQYNAQTLVELLAKRGISVMGVTKAVLGSPEIAKALVRAGVSSLGDSRIENIETMHLANIPISMALIRSPMLSQASLVVQQADISFNSELETISKLSSAAQELGRNHGVVLMIELGDLREGIMPGDLEDIVRQTLRFPNIALMGIGTNLACRSGVSPDEKNMGELSALADSIEARFGLTLEIVSGGNSGNLRWALSGADPGRVNNLRLGEALLLGREPLHRTPIEGLHTDAIMLVAEIIESKVKPSTPWGEIAQSSFGKQPPPLDRGSILQTIAAVGRQDIDPSGLTPPSGIKICGSSSDHLILDAGKFDAGKLETSTRRYSVGDEIRFDVNYSALLRAMTSPYVKRVLMGTRGIRRSDEVSGLGLEFVQ